MPKNNEQIPVEVRNLPTPRLKAYRKRLQKSYHSYGWCDICWGICEHNKDEVLSDGRYKFLESELEKTNAELAIRCKKQVVEEEKKNKLQVSTIREWKRHHHPPRREWVKEMKKTHKRR